jgi:hypothetical protein
MTQAEQILAAMSGGRYGVREAIALVTNNPAERKELTMFTHDKLMAALESVRTAIEQQQVMSADVHAAMCEHGSECWEHACTMGRFLRAVDGSQRYVSFPSISKLEALFNEMGLPTIASRVWRIVALNDQGRLSEALDGLKSAVESC